MALEHNPYQPPAVEVPHVELSPEGAAALPSRGARLIASSIDALAVGAVTLPIQYFAGVFDHFPHVTISTGAQLLWQLVGAGVFLLLQGPLLATRAQTLGKRVMGLRIATLDGRPADLQRILVKRVLPVFVAQSVPAVGGVLAIVNVLFIFRADRRCLHDLIAETQVVKV
jgi:uncharacterized RDD family membrane protein YckC